MTTKAHKLKINNKKILTKRLFLRLSFIYSKLLLCSNFYLEPNFMN